MQNHSKLAFLVEVFLVICVGFAGVFCINNFLIVFLNHYPGFWENLGWFLSFVCFDLFLTLVFFFSR